MTSSRENFVLLPDDYVKLRLSQQFPTKRNILEEGSVLNLSGEGVELITLWCLSTPQVFIDLKNSQ